jgi:23S rRNA G2069 N7-methylase RlmK/C1962 C5-methylase RlmI
MMGIRTFFALFVALGGAATTSVDEAIQARRFASFAV